MLVNLNTPFRNLRSALGDVTSVAVNVAAEAGGDVKRQKMENFGHVGSISKEALTE